MAAAKTTTNHDEIRKWVEKNGGCPARVKATGRTKGDPGILRIDYPGFSGQETLVKMDWDAWFQAFEDNGLAFIYQPTTRFSKLVSRTNARAGSGSSRSTSRRSATGGRRGGAKKSTSKRTARRGATASTAKKRATKRPAKRSPKRTTKRTTRRATSRSRA